MTAHELKEELLRGKYIIASFGNISLWEGIDRERTIHPNIFRALIKKGVLHEECIECGASRFVLKTPTEKEILKARVEELEEAIKGWHHVLASGSMLDRRYFIGLMEKVIRGNDE